MLIVKDEKIFKEQCEKVSENNEERQALLSGKCSKATVNGAGFRAVRSVCRGLTHACSGPAGKISTSLWERNRPLAEGRWGSRVSKQKVWIPTLIFVTKFQLYQR